MLEDVPCKQRHGVLLVDEMKTKSGLVFNKHTGWFCPMRRRQTLPTPMRRRQTLPTPMRRRQMLPTPMRRRPTPMRRRQTLPTPMRRRQTPPTPMRWRQMPPTPMQRRQSPMRRRQTLPTLNHDIDVVIQGKPEDSNAGKQLLVFMVRAVFKPSLTIPIVHFFSLNLRGSYVTPIH